MAKRSYELLSTDGGTLFIETKCPRARCEKPYRIDEYHPEFKRIKEALDRGDRSVLFCYHKALA